MVTTLSTSQSNHLNRLIAECMAGTGTSWSLLDAERFKAIFSFIGVSSISRNTFTVRYLPEFYDIVVESDRKFILDAKSLTLAFDGWTQRGNKGKDLF